MKSRLNRTIRARLLLTGPFSDFHAPRTDIGSSYGGFNLIENGAIQIKHGKIAAIGRARQVLHAGDEAEDLGNAVVIPALVNSHTHLELSGAIQHHDRITRGRGFVPWVRSIMKQKALFLNQEAMVSHSMEMALGGVLSAGDHGNSELAVILKKRLSHILTFLAFQEIIHPAAGIPDYVTAFSKRLEAKAQANIAGSDEDPILSIACHSPFLCSPQVIGFAKEMSRKYGLPFSIHLAESPEETEFLKNGRGPLYELMEERGRMPLPYSLPGKGPVEYLDSLGVLDKKTICIHCVQIGREDMKTLTGRGSWISLCPRSNRFIGVGDAPAEQLFNMTDRICIGTDSLASNEDLDLFAEMAALAKICRNTNPARILQAATLGGARALGLVKTKGSLKIGMDADLVVVPTDRLTRLDELMEFLVKECHQIRHRFKVMRNGSWITAPD